MNTDKNRRGVAAIGLASLPGVAVFRKHEPDLTAASRLLVVLLILLFTILLMSNTALARPVLERGDESVVAAERIMNEETAGAAGTAEERRAGKDGAQAKRSAATPKAEPNGKFLVEPYQDPGEEQQTKGFFARALQTVVDVVKYIFYFGLVIALGVLAIYGVKTFTTKYNAITGGGHELLNILEVRYLAPGKAVCLVEVAGKVLVLGVAGNNISALSELDDIEQVEGLKHRAAQKPQPLQPFQAYLEKFTNRFAAAPKKAPCRRASREHVVADDTNHWRDDLRSTGENINKILEELKKQDGTGPRSSGQTAKRRRGEDER